MLKYNEGIYQGKIDQLTEYISMLNGHIEKLTTYKDQLRINYAPFCFCRSTYDFFETIPNKPLLNLEKY